MCEHLREQISDINDNVLKKFNKLVADQEELEAELNAPKLTHVDKDLGYTPVTAETFSAWCEGFMAHLKSEEEQAYTE